MHLGRIGIWRRRHDGADAVAEIEALGYTTLWVGGSPSLEQVRPFLERSSTLTVATGILNVWQHEPSEVAAPRDELVREFPNILRFGFTERDIADGGSDRLIDAVIPHGSAERIAEAVQAHLDAGADHVALQPLGHGPAPVADYEALAGALL